MTKLRKDFITTFLTEFIVLGSSIIAYKLAANFLGNEGFSEYVLSRRNVSLFQPALLMGLSIGIPRYLAYASTENPGSKKSDAYFISGLSVLVVVIITFTIILNLFKANLAYLLFGSIEYIPLIFPINVMLIGSILHAAAYSYFRGHLLMIRANILQMVNLGLVPLLALCLGKTTRDVLIITGSCWSAISLLSLFAIAKNIKWEGTYFLSCIKELLSYGLQRVPGDFAYAALFTLPATFTAHIRGVQEAGYVAFAASVSNMIGTVFVPVGLILLPQASQIIAGRNFEMLRYYSNRLLKITFFMTVLGVVFFEIFADTIIELYLGQSYSEIIFLTRIIVIGSVAHTIFISLRSIIDAYYLKALNTINIIIALLLFLLLSAIVAFFSKGYIYIVVCFVVAIFLLGSLTLLEIRKILKRELHLKTSDI